MAKLSQKQKAGLLFGGAALVAMLIIGKAEGSFDGMLEKVRPPKLPPGPFGEKKPGDPAPKKVGEISGKARPVLIPCPPLSVPEDPCMLCTTGEDGKFYLQVKMGCAGLPALEPWEIGINLGHDEYKIGNHWVINVLYPFLEVERQQGRLATYDHDAGSIATFLWDDPTTFLNETFGWEGRSETYKGQTMLAMATVLAAGSPWVTKLLPLAGYKFSAGRGISKVIKASASVSQKLAKAQFVAEMGSLGYGALASKLGHPELVVNVNGTNQPGPGLIYDTTTRTYRYGDKYLREMPEELGDLLTSANEAFLKLMETHTAIVGEQNPKEVILGDIPVIGPTGVPLEGMLDMFGEIWSEIYQFQKRHFEWPSSGNIFSWLYD